MTPAPHTSATSEAELKPCPFCGGSPELVCGGPGNWYVRCLSCKAATDDGMRDRAVASWNTRAMSEGPATSEAELIALADRLEKHVKDRGGSALENGAWAMMLEAADVIRRLQRDCAEAYQVIGVLAEAHGDMFSDPQVAKALDNLSAAVDPIEPRPHDDLLPFTLPAPADGGWQPIETRPTEPVQIELFFGLLTLIDHDTQKEASALIEPYRDERRSLGYWDGEDFCYCGTGHRVFEPGIPKEHLPTHWRFLPAPPTSVSSNSRGGH